MHTSVTRNVTGSTSAMSVGIQGATMRKDQYMRKEQPGKYLLHGLEDNRVVTHTKVIISTPNLDFVLGVSGVSNGELGRKTVDVIEVTVGGILVLFLKLSKIELLIVETSGGSGCLSSLGRSLGVEWASSSSFGRGRLGGSLGTLLLLSFSKVLGHACGSESLGSMWALVNIFTGVSRENTLVVVHAVDLGITGYARIASDELAGANLKRGAHDGTFRCFLRELRERRVARRRGGAESAKSRGLCAAQKGAGGRVLCERGKLVNHHRARCFDSRGKGTGKLEEKDWSSCHLYELPLMGGLSKLSHVARLFVAGIGGHSLATRQCYTATDKIERREARTAYLSITHYYSTSIPFYPTIHTYRPH